VLPPDRIRLHLPKQSSEAHFNSFDTRSVSIQSYGFPFEVKFLNGVYTDHNSNSHAYAMLFVGSRHFHISSFLVFFPFLTFWSGVVHVDRVRVCVWTAATNGPIVHPPDDTWVWRAMVEWYWRGNPKKSEEKPIPVPLCPLQSHMDYWPGYEPWLPHWEVWN
jgi:hypothetical protein